ncbi:HIT family protein [Nocardia africana]|uniref:HIT family protein n=1 Tax=Nocardia africana TaxID=134964 RepID=A0ABW6NFV1_9NOCA
MTWQTERVRSALRGTNPTVLARLPESFAVIGDVQFLPGYCVLLTDTPQVSRLSDLPRPRRIRYLEAVDRLATAVELVCARFDDQFTRVNIEILGNRDPYLHTHIWPRYRWEPDSYRRSPVWLYPREWWHDPEQALGARHDVLRAAITGELVGN